MSSPRNANVGPAYDFIAADYDELMQPDMRMRRALWRHYARVFRPGDSVLDFGCGTGTDAIHMARLGIRATGIDASHGMISEFRRKADAEGLAIEARRGSLAELRVFAPASFAGITSAFAALNTVPDLPAFAAEAHRLLRPGGRMIGHFLAAPGAWEILECLTAGHWSEARERRNSREKTIAVCGEPVTHILLSPRETYNRFFTDRFRLRKSYGLGFLWPQRWDGIVPPAVASLGNRIEAIGGQFRPFSDWGRFFVLDLERR
ncbi:MAG: class I SAM-dependent methyltransferase [Bryobacteraceae bacterium]